MPKVKTTKSSKRYTFASFRERIDNIKIEPSKRLNRRAFDDAETSHFLSTMERWTEFNRSAGFTNFVEVVQNKSQSLVQIIHYRRFIFDQLVVAISKNDPLSLQPLMELLTQFCHDLGPDFMEFYTEAVQLIIDVSLGEVTSETLEWEFNCLAFIFKYLSKILTQDLIPTFKMLEPLFVAKEYISRFSAEALSFLLRKTSQEELLRFTDAAFSKIGNENYNKSIVILFSESMKSTQGAIHSKFVIIIRSLLGNLSSDDASSVLCDILLSVLNFGSEDSVKDLYTLITDINKDNMQKDPTYVKHFVKVTTILIFADSGRKIPNWSLITDAIDYLIQNVEFDKLENSTRDLIVYLFAIFFRNCELQVLTRYHTTLFRYAFSLDLFFLPFIVTIIDLARERALQYAKPSIQEFINKRWEANTESIAYFITDLEERELISKGEDLTKIRISIPTKLLEKINAELATVSISDSSDLYQVFWRFCILGHCTGLDISALLNVLEQLKQFGQVSEFRDTVLSKTISMLALTQNPSTWDIILENFEQLHINLTFITATNHYLRSHKNLVNNADQLIAIVADNLNTPNHDLKHESLQLIRSLAAGFDQELVTLANQCDIIEQIPHTMENSRDIQLRMRGFAGSFKNLEASDLRSQVYLKYLIGMLSVRFSPSWSIVYEVLPSIYHKNKALVWDILYNFIIGAHSEGKRIFYDGMSDDIVEYSSDWTIIDTRLQRVIETSKGVVSRYFNTEHSFLVSSEAKYKTEQFPGFMCIHAIEALKKVPDLVEQNSPAIISIVLDPTSVDGEDESRAALNKTEQSALLGLFASFKKLKNVVRADELYQKFLNLLSSRTPEVRKIALDCLLNFKDQRVIKYKDSLQNLLDDSMFRDEVQKITSKGEERIIEDQDEEIVMPLILRIVFGRAQSNNISGNKKGIKFGAISILPQLQEKYIVDFLKIVSEKVYISEDEVMDFDNINIENLTSNDFRRSLGFTNMLSDLISTLNEKYKELLKGTINPLLYSLVLAELAIGSDSVEKNIQAVARNIRTSGMKDLLMLFDLLDEFSWDEYIEIIYEKVLAPRFVNFEVENLQQTSHLLKLMVCWSQYKGYLELLLINDLEPAASVLSLLTNSNTKPEVISIVIDFCINVVTKVAKKTKFQGLTQLVSSKVFDSLQGILTRVVEPHINAKIIDLLLALVENKFVETQERRESLVDLATVMLEKPTIQLSKLSRLQVLRTLKALIEDFEGEFEQVQHLFDVSAKYLKYFKDREQREVLIELFVEIGNRFSDFSRVATYLTELNSFSRRGLGDFDYDTRLIAFRDINEVTYKELRPMEWLPLLNTSLYFITEVDDLAIRSNASYTLRRFVDSFSAKDEADRVLIRIFKDVVLSNLRIGLRNKSESVQSEFISVLAHCVAHLKHVDDFDDLKVLLFNNDDEANFFLNINHIQLHRRQRAIKRLGQVASQMSGSNIAHYILPMIERYAYVTDEKFRNIANETVLTIEELIACVSYKQFIAIFKRYQAGLKEGSEVLRDSVSLVVTITKALLRNFKNEDQSKRMEGLPEESDTLDVQLEREMIEPLCKILNKRNEETSIYRAPLIEALSCLILCLTHERIVVILPSVLTKICQILRTRHDELRDAVRKNLGRAARTLGSKYIMFIIKELKTALARGFQIHVLGFTVHSIISSMQFKHGELDDSAGLITEVIMENIFGTTGQEKEADGYRTTMKEVKHNKSFDLGELLARAISLPRFNDVISPIKLLLQERITLKIQNKLDELLRRLTLGIYKNEDSTKQDMLVLCFQLFKESERDFASERRERKTKESEKHFLVQMTIRSQRVVSENSVYIDTFQKLSLEMLRTTLNKNPHFINGEALTGFIPFFESALESENETVIVSVVKILGQIIHVNFDTDGDIFKRGARKSLSIIKNYPSTESDVVQSCFKFLSQVIRHREDLGLKDSSLGYLLVKIQPDLSEQNRQGLAFNFLKAIVAKHVLLPEVYETMDKIREVMVTSHTKERRDMSRSIYYQFLMEFDQGRGRLENQFKFLVDNLSYPAEAGQQSVLELIHLIIQKSGPELLDAVSSSFFVALAKVLISDTSAKSREMSLALITSIFEKKGTKSFEKFIRGWMNSKNSALLRCSLLLYKIKVKVSGMDSESELDADVLHNIKEILLLSRSDSETDVKWELVYAALTCLGLVAERDPNAIDEELKRDIIASLLFPHSWIRLASSRLIGVLMSTKRDLFTDSDIQNIGYRLFHQLNAPSVDEKLGSQAIKTLSHALVWWQKNSTIFDHSLKTQSKAEAEEEEEEPVEQKMSEWAVKRASAIVRSERSSLEAKRAGVQFLAMATQVLSSEKVKDIGEDFILALFTLTENTAGDESKQEIQNLGLECMKLVEDKIGVTEYTAIYSRVNQFVVRRRQDRRTQRARLAITAPELAARRKEKKHGRTREKRKLDKDENGLYHTKKKQQR